LWKGEATETICRAVNICTKIAQPFFTQTSGASNDVKHGDRGFVLKWC